MLKTVEDSLVERNVSLLARFSAVTFSRMVERIQLYFNLQRDSLKLSLV